MGLKQKLRHVVESVPGGRRLYDSLMHRPPRAPPLDRDSLNQQLQKIILNQYRDSFRRGEKPFEAVSEAGFRCYSQFEEDGIILYILSAIGMKTRRVVEICCADGSECMATNLVLSHGYEAYMFDGDAANVAAANAFFRARKDCLLTPPKVRHAWITPENINGLLRDVGASGEVDLLSLDIDGNDFHLWEAISEINPRLCVFETHNIIPTDRSLTIPYEANFNAWSKDGPERDFRSASLQAMTKLSASKGYRLIGGHRHGFNAFFLRNDLAPDIFPEVPVAALHDNTWTREGQAKRWPAVKDMAWVEV